MIHSWLTVA